MHPLGLQPGRSIVILDREIRVIMTFRLLPTRVDLGTNIGQGMIHTKLLLCVREGLAESVAKSLFLVHYGHIWEIRLDDDFADLVNAANIAADQLGQSGTYWPVQ